MGGKIETQNCSDTVLLLPNQLNNKLVIQGYSGNTAANHRTSITITEA